MYIRKGTHVSPWNHICAIQMQSFIIILPSASNIQQAMLKLSLLATDKEHVNMGNIEYFHEMRGILFMGLSSNKRGDDLASYKQIILQHMI